MVPTEFLQIVEGLNHLDPIRTYPERAAKHVAALAKATAYRVELDEDERSLDSTPPPPQNGNCVSIPLRHGRHTLGVIHLYLPEGAPTSRDSPDLRLARFGARILARGLTYAHRLGKGGDGRRRPQDLHSRLERTPLTPREKEVVGFVVSGASTRQTAEQTGLTVATVHTYLKRIYSKMGVHSRVQLIARMAGTVGSAPTHGEEGDTRPPEVSA